MVPISSHAAGSRRWTSDAVHHSTPQDRLKRSGNKLAYCLGRVMSICAQEIALEQSCASSTFVCDLVSLRRLIKKWTLQWLQRFPCISFFLVCMMWRFPAFNLVVRDMARIPCVTVEPPSFGRHPISPIQTHPRKSVEVVTSSLQRCWRLMTATRLNGNQIA